MRNYLIAIFLMVFVNPYYSLSQINLIPNPSFEDTTVDCIYSGLGGVSNNKCLNWFSCRSSSDYWTPCSQSYAVPYTGASFQYAHTGDKMVGFVTYATQNIMPGLFREIPGVDLIQSTNSGQRYYYSMFINQAFSSLQPAWCLLATNKIGVKLTNATYSPGVPVPINNIADFVDTLVHTDTLGWTKISGSFISNGSFNKLMIGNFFDDAHTDTINLENNGLTYQNAVAYYFIDDVCLSTDSLYAATWTGIETAPQTQLIHKVFPNPAQDFLTIDFGSSGAGNCIMELYSLDGRLLLKKEELMSVNSQLDIRQFPPGMYLLKINTNKGASVVKVLKE
jgi:hypothetical protein